MSSSPNSLWQDLFGFEAGCGRPCYSLTLDWDGLVQDARVFDALFLAGEYVELRYRSVHNFKSDAASQCVHFGDTGRIRCGRTGQSERNRRWCQVAPSTVYRWGRHYYLHLIEPKTQATGGQVD